MVTATRWQVEQATKQLQASDFIYLQDGPRQGDVLQAPGHAGKVCVGLVAGQVPRLGSELVYESANQKTADGMRCYKLVVRRLTEEA